MSDIRLTIDGSPLPVQLSGTTAAAVALQPINVSSCDRRTRNRLVVHLDAGRHEVRSGAGAETGLDVDRIVWSSRAGGRIVAQT